MSQLLEATSSHSPLILPQNTLRQNNNAQFQHIAKSKVANTINTTTDTTFKQRVVTGYDSNCSHFQLNEHNNKEFTLTFHHIESFFTNYCALDFTQPLTTYTVSTFRFPPNDFHYMLCHLYDLFSHSFSIFSTFSMLENTTTQTIQKIQKIPLLHPIFTFPDVILDIFKNLNLNSNKSLFRLLFKTPQPFIVNPSNTIITALSATHIDINSFATNKDNNSPHHVLSSFPLDNLDAQKYIQHVLDVVGDPITFAAHLRHTFLLQMLCYCIQLQGKLSPETFHLMNPILQTILRHCLVHFHIICEYYDITQCGSLDFSYLVDHITINLNKTMTSMRLTSHHYFPPPNSFSADEKHFLTTILPTAFQSSPMYPGEMNKGMLFPLSIEPTQYDAFTQHYTKLLPTLADTTNIHSQPSSTATTTAPFQKVPITKIPFSIFAYLALICRIMSELWGSFILNTQTSNNQSLNTIFLQIPHLPTDLEFYTMSYARRTVSHSHSLLRIETIHFLYLKLKKFINFPILPKNPLSSLQPYKSLRMIDEMREFISNIIDIPTLHTTSPSLHHLASLFGLQLVQIMTIMLWSKQFVDTSQVSRKSTISLGKKNTNVSSIIHHQQTELHLSTPSTYSSTDLPHDNLFATAVFTNNINCIERDRHYFGLILRLAEKILLHVPSLDICSRHAILSCLSPSFLFVIFSLVIRYHYGCDLFIISLGNCLSYDLDPQLDSSIRCLLNFYIEYQFSFGNISQSFYQVLLSRLLSPTDRHYANNNLFILSTNNLPCFSHILSSIYYGSAIYQQDYSIEEQNLTALSQSQLSQLLSPLTTTNSTITSVDLSIEPPNAIQIVEKIIQHSHGHAVYRKQPQKNPTTYPSTIQYIRGLFSYSDIAPQFTRHVTSPPVPKVSHGLLENLAFSFFYIFRNAGVSLLSNNLYYINFTPNLSNHTLLQQLQSQPQPQPHCSSYIHPPSLAQSIQSSTNAITTQRKDITMHSFSHPSTLLGMNPQLYCIPYMAIQHNFSRTLFHFISSNNWNELSYEANNFLDYNYFIPTLLYLNLFHTFLCKPIAIIQIEKEMDQNLSTSTVESTPITLFQRLTSLTNNNNSIHSTSTLDALKLWNCGAPSSTSTSISTLITPLSASDQHPLHTILTNVETFSDSSLITYSSVNTATQAPAAAFNFHNFCQTPHYKANLYKHAHLPPSVIKQLYYIYTEALLFTIQGFAYASFTTPLLNDPTASNVTQSEHQKTTDIGISSLSSPGCSFEWDANGIPLGKIDNLKTELQWNQLTDFGGTIQQATEMFRCDEDKSSVSTVQNDSYHQHIVNLHSNPQQVLYSFQPQRDDYTILQRASTSVPDYVLDQQRTGTIAIAYEWSSAMVQHSIELFVELLLNQGSWEFVSQIDFSDDKQPLAEEYVIDFIPRDPADWDDKTKWTSNIPPNCTDKDTTFPLYKQFVPTKYQAQLPSLATASLCPAHLELLPHSIYNPNNITQGQEQKNALVSYYNENTSLVPAFSFPQDDREYIREKLRKFGFKTPTRGHLPYFYNLSADEQHELYQTFSFYNTSSITNTSSASATIPTAITNKPLSFDIDLTEYVHHLNNEISFTFEQEMLRGYQNCSLLNNMTSLEMYSERLAHQGQAQYLIEHYINTPPTPSTPSTPSCSQSNFAQIRSNEQSTSEIYSHIDSQDIVDIFTMPFINDNNISPPQLLPTTFTIPTSLLFEQFQSSKSIQP